MLRIKITQLGIYVEDQFYPYNMINSFWLVYQPPFVRTLNLRLVGKTTSRLVIQMDTKTPWRCVRFWPRRFLKSKASRKPPPTL